MECDICIEKYVLWEEICVSPITGFMSFHAGWGIMGVHADWDIMGPHKVGGSGPPGWVHRLDVLTYAWGGGGGGSATRPKV